MMVFGLALFYDGTDFEVFLVSLNLKFLRCYSEEWLKSSELNCEVKPFS